MAVLDMPGSRFAFLHRNSAEFRRFETILKLVGWRKAKRKPIRNIVHRIIASGHGKGLGPAFQDGLGHFSCGEIIPHMAVFQESRVGRSEVGAGKWADMTLTAPG